MRNRKPIPAGPWLNFQSVTEMLRRQVRGNQSAWAKEHKISLGYVNDVINGRRLPGGKITKAMGLEKALLWRTPSR